MIIGNQPRLSWKTRHNHELQSQMVTWDTDTVAMKERDAWTKSSREALLKDYLRANEPQTLSDEYSRATKILDAEYKQVSTSLDDVIKTCENLHVKEQYQLKILLPKYDHLEYIWWNIRRIQYTLLNQLVSNWWILLANRFMRVHTLFLDQWNTNCKVARIL
jgi:hypothetical protein